MGREYKIPAESIDYLARTRELSPTVGLRVVHHSRDLPETLIFFPFRWRRVAAVLREEGFEVRE